MASVFPEAERGIARRLRQVFAGSPGSPLFAVAAVAYLTARVRRSMGRRMNMSVKPPASGADLGGAAGPRRAGDSPKSLRTRARILETAMRLFVEIGYYPATNAVIAEASGLTRGAMLYHFASREALLDAAIPFIQAAREGLLKSAAQEMPAGADRADHAIDSYWRLLHTAPFVAFAELEAAARTDETLRARLQPAQAAFDRAQLGGAGAAELLSAGEAPRLQASRDLARLVLEGLARAHLADGADARTTRLLDVVKRATHMLNRKGSPDGLWPQG